MTFAMAFAGGMRAGGLLAVCSLLPCAAAWNPGVTRSPWARSRTRLPTCNALSAADEERLLLTEPASRNPKPAWKYCKFENVFSL